MSEMTHIPGCCRKQWKAIVTALVLVGLLLRVFGAWASRLITDPDAGVVALMARHIASGSEWPVFFYGQSYMGSLEPIVSGLVCMIIGISGFGVGLGTALVATACLPVIYLWGKESSGAVAGLIALTICLIGPYDYYMFQFNPRGGYMVTVLLGLLIMMLSSRTACLLYTSDAADE